jgi:hypothetical protein
VASPDPAKLPTAARLTLAMSGLAAFGSGAAAVFVDSGSGGAGAAALIAVGVLGVALAAVGVLPTNLAVGLEPGSATDHGTICASPR